MTHLSPLYFKPINAGKPLSKKAKALTTPKATLKIATIKSNMMVVSHQQTTQANMSSSLIELDEDAAEDFVQPAEENIDVQDVDLDISEKPTSTEQALASDKELVIEEEGLEAIANTDMSIIPQTTLVHKDVGGLQRQRFKPLLPPTLR